MPLTTKVQQMRKARLNLVLKTIKALGSVGYMKLIGLLGINYGFTTTVIKEYISQLKDADLIRVEKGIVYPSELTTKLEKEEIKKAEKELDKYEAKKTNGTKV